MLKNWKKIEDLGQVKSGDNPFSIPPLIITLVIMYSLQAVILAVMVTRKLISKPQYLRHRQRKEKEESEEELKTKDKNSVCSCPFDKTTRQIN